MYTYPSYTIVYTNNPPEYYSHFLQIIINQKDLEPIRKILRETNSKWHHPDIRLSVQAHTLFESKNLNFLLAVYTAAFLKKY